MSDFLKSTKLFWFIAVAILISSLLMFTQAATAVDGVRGIIRITARFSLVLFLIAYTAHAFYMLNPSKLSSWLLSKRRQIGLSFVFSHTVHAIAILTFANLDPILFKSLTPTANWITGGLAYIILWTMGATSFNGAVKWLGAKNWSRLHTWGSHYIWISFMVSFGKRIPMSSFYSIAIVLLLIALGLRLIARRKKRMEII